MATILVVAFTGLTALSSLGAWQLQRLTWKRELIARVEQRVHTEPMTAPGRAQWPQIDAASSEYRHVVARGYFRHDSETLVQAVTEHGGGFWVMTPFDTVDGDTILINRGFVLPAHRDPATRSSGQVTGLTTVTGLVRMSEPRGGYLRRNEAAADRWYSRDVAAIAAKRGLREVAPYFIDAAANGHGAPAPIGGLTIIRFANHHLQYAITWFILAGMIVSGAFLVLRQEYRAPILREMADSAPLHLVSNSPVHPVHIFFSNPVRRTGDAARNSIRGDCNESQHEPPLPS